MAETLEVILEPTGKIRLTGGKLPDHPVKARIKIVEEPSRSELAGIIKEMEEIRERFDKNLSGKSGTEIIREWRDKRAFI